MALLETPDFLALSGMALARQAALLLLVEPRLAGLLLVGGHGSGKSALLESACHLAKLAARLSPECASEAISVPRLAHHFDQIPLSGQLDSLSEGSLLAAAREVPPALDRFGLTVCLPEAAPAQDRLAVLLIGSEGETADLEALAHELIDARRLLPSVALTAAQVRLLCEVAVALAVTSSRADCFAALAARASAALDGRRAVDAEDLEIAVKLVLAPRARSLPEPPRSAMGDRDTGAGDDPPAGSNASQSGAGEAPPSGGALDDGAPARELLLAAAQLALPPDLLPGQAQAEAVEGGRGRVVRSSPRRRQAAQTLSLAATLEAALPWQRARGWVPGQRLRVRAEDFRWQVRRRPAGSLHLIVFDASASMASNRMAQAKGAVTHLLRQAYASRDRVALVAFRRREAALLLPPTRGLALARQALDRLPAGGGTPLEAGLDVALKTILLARQQDASQQVRLLLVTDGGVGPAGAVAWRDYGQRFAALGVDCTLLDTRPPFAGSDRGRDLAGWLGARWVRLETRPESMPRWPGEADRTALAFREPSAVEGLESR